MSCNTGSFCSGGKEGMKTVSYKDPYEPIPVVIQIEDDDEEGFEKALEFLNENTRHIQNAERKERYHTALHLEGLTYEGEEYAAKRNDYEEAELQEEEAIIDEWLRENLTEVQYRRFRLLMDGLSIRDVARYEAADYSSVYESINAARKKLIKILKITPSKVPKSLRTMREEFLKIEERRKN